jgi:Cytochrome c7 and related cytochrome c
MLRTRKAQGTGHRAARFLALCSVPYALSVLFAACGAPPPADPALVFTQAHRTTGEALGHFFNTHPTAAQPIAFPHKTHLAKGATCTDCHETVERGPIAGIPSVKICMTCHSQIATTKPLIKEVTAYSDKGVEIPWQRVYGFPHESHVRFNHAPHIRANVDCKSCHGDLAAMTVAERVVDHNMGFCVTCHREKNASNDCLTCHF